MRHRDDAGHRAFAGRQQHSPQLEAIGGGQAHIFRPGRRAQPLGTRMRARDHVELRVGDGGEPARRQPAIGDQGREGAERNGGCDGAAHLALPDDRHAQGHQVAPQRADGAAACRDYALEISGIGDRRRHVVGRAAQIQYVALAIAERHRQPTRPQPHHPGRLGAEGFEVVAVQRGGIGKRLQQVLSLLQLALHGGGDGVRGVPHPARLILHLQRADEQQQHDGVDGERQQHERGPDRHEALPCRNDAGGFGGRRGQAERGARLGLHGELAVRLHLTLRLGCSGRNLGGGISTNNTTQPCIMPACWMTGRLLTTLYPARR